MKEFPWLLSQVQKVLGSNLGAEEFCFSFVCLFFETQHLKFSTKICFSLVSWCKRAYFVYVPTRKRLPANLWIRLRCIYTLHTSRFCPFLAGSKQEPQNIIGLQNIWSSLSLNYWNTVKIIWFFNWVYL